MIASMLPAEVVALTDSSPSLWLAAQSGRTRVVQKLLEVRADPDRSEQKMGRSPLWEASWSNRTGVVRCLLEARAEVEVCMPKDTLDTGTKW